jgi:hypothetical protein
MNLKRLLITLSVFTFTLLVFLFTETKKEESSDVNFWNYDFEELQYTPPEDGYPEKDLFISLPLIFKRYHTGLRSHPFFEVRGLDPSSHVEYQYEGGYPVKNAFIDFSVLKTKTMSKEDSNTLTKFSLQTYSPKIELGEKGIYEKSLLIGEKNRDKSSRYVLTEGFLITLQNYMIDKFTNKPQSLRHRQILSLGDDLLSEIKLKTETSVFHFQNHGSGKWFQFKGKWEVVEPNPINRMESILKSLSYDLYPDDEIADGFTVAAQLTSGKPQWTLDLITDKNQGISLHIYEEITFKSTHYCPIVRKKAQWTESPAYIKKDTLLQIIQLAKEMYDTPTNGTNQRN